MAAKLSVTLSNIIDYWTLSHIMCLKSYWISVTKIILMEVSRCTNTMTRGCGSAGIFIAVLDTCSTSGVYVQCVLL